MAAGVTDDLRHRAPSALTGWRRAPGSGTRMKSLGGDGTTAAMSRVHADRERLLVEDEIL
jgi:hypothetical protein